MRIIICRELTQNSQAVRDKKKKKGKKKKKKKRENTHQRKEKKKEKKQSHAQDIIYVVRQFVYVHGVARISLLSRKNTKCSNTMF